MSQTKVTDALRDVTAVDGAKITTGTIPEARITSLDATKLTGNIANARIPASAVTQHVTGYNDASIRADILKLALHQAIDGNRAAYNLEDSFIDGFEDDTGITTETTVDRDATGEYVNSVAISESSGTPAYATGDRRSIITLTYDGFTFAGGTPNGMLDGVSGSYGISSWPTGMTPSAGAYLRFQFSDDNTTGSTKKLITENKWYQNTTHSAAVWQWQGSNDASTWTDIGSTFTMGGSTTQTVTTMSSNTTPYTYYQMLWQSGANVANPYWQEIQFKQADVTTSTTTAATGTLISDPQTASTSRTSASGVIIYEDAVGTNTLGTDLKIYFSCNNSAWTEASSYGTATTYSGTKKLVKLGATTCTAGTQVAMKAEWANQSASSTAIADAAGTIIGDFTTNPSNAFNNTVSTRTNSAQRSTSTNAYIGKDLGAGNGRTITGASWDRPTDADSMDSASTMTTYLYASNSAPTSYNDGTLLGTIGTETNNTGTSQMSKLDFSNSTTYRYVWIHASSPSSNNFWCAEAKFYGTDLTSKEARLHGWAVNY